MFMESTRESTRLQSNYMLKLIFMTNLDEKSFYLRRMRIDGRVMKINAEKNWKIIKSNGSY